MNLPRGKIEKEKTNHKVQGDKTDEGEDRIAGGNVVAVALIRPE
jgi:hypothetical protein